MLSLLQSRLHKQISSWYPQYANRTLPGLKRRLVSWWLSHNQVARNEYHAVQSLQQVLHGQRSLSPRPEIYQNLQALLINQKQFTPTPVRQRQLWAIPLGLLIVAGILLWQALPPGITLAWSTQGQEVQSFRVYRGTGLKSGDNS